MANISERRRTDMATRLIAASPQTIYQAFLDPEAWVKWLPPQGMTGHIFQFEPRPGGAYRMALTYSSGNHSARGKTSEDSDVVEGRFAEVVPDEKVVHLALVQISRHEQTLPAAPRRLQAPSTAFQTAGAARP